MQDIILLKQGEIVLKGLNKKYFEQKLISNVKRRLRSLGEFDVTCTQSTIYVEPKSDDIDMDETQQAMTKVFGIAAVVRAAACDKTPEAMAQATAEEIYAYIKSISYPNNKARNLAAMARMLCTEFGGVVPSDLDALQRLPGVGRKTANVVGAVIWGKEVMPVDTHVFRVSARIGLTRGAKTPLQTELQLEKNIPSHLLPVAHHWLILHGRYVCTARAPKCDACGIAPWCKSREKQKMADK